MRSARHRIAGRRHGWVIGGIIGCWSLLAVGVGQAAPEPVKLRVAAWTSGAFGDGFKAAVAAYQKLHPDVQIQLTGSNTWIPQEMGGDPPDLTLIDGPVVTSAGLQGLLTPLDPFIQADKVNPADFVPPSWKQNLWAGKVWALPLEVDPNFALIWNQDDFSNAGLDPDRGPATIEEWQADFAKLTKHSADNRLTQIGDVPWDVYGNPNTMYTWGWIYGGEFFDYAHNKVTADDPANVQALTFLRDYFRRYNPELGALNAGMPSGLNRFTSGRQAMKFSVSGELFDYLKQLPNLKLGIAVEPHQAGSTENPAWAGGWCLGIPAHAKHKQEAWDFLRFIAATPEGTTAFAEASGWYPAYRVSPVFSRYLLQDKYLKTYAEVALNATHMRPAIPVGQKYWDELDAALNRVFAGKEQPQAALQDVSRLVQQELDKALAR